jgi:hypothetical protein
MVSDHFAKKEQTMKTKFTFKLIAALLFSIAMSAVAFASVTPEQTAYCTSQGGYVASDDACWVGTPETCGPTSPSYGCVDPVPQLGMIIKMCSCQ